MYYRSFGNNSNKGNIVGLSPDMSTADYSCAEAFHRKLDLLFSEASSKKLFGEKTIVSLAEYFGMWLVAADENDDVYSALTMKSAILLMCKRYFPSLSVLLPISGFNIRKSIFWLKSQTMVDVYNYTYPKLAKKYGVTIVTGSTVLPKLEVRNGMLELKEYRKLLNRTIGRGNLYNTAVIYRPDGAPDPEIVLKAYPTNSENGFVSPSTVEKLPVFDTPAGRMGAIICSDSWYPDIYEHFRNKKIDFMVVPSMGTGVDTETWIKPWNGYSGYAPPADVLKQHHTDQPGTPGSQRLTEEQAWMEYALPKRLKTSGASKGMTVVDRSIVWDFKPYAKGIVVDLEKNEIHTTSVDNGAMIVNLWL